MNQNLFIILIGILVIGLIWNNSQIKNVENMNNCELNDKTILDNPIFKDIYEIKNKKLINYLIDFNNNVIDLNLQLKDLVNDNEIVYLEKIINSYRAFNPVTNIKITNEINLKIIKNLILKNIILNHLQCFGDSDPELFWIRLHLINKPKLDKSNIQLINKKDPIIEMFNENNENFSDINDLDKTKIISFNKHQKHIAHVLIKKHPILKEILNDYSLVFNLELHEIILKILDYLTTTKNKGPEIKNLYLDLRELILINQIMTNNPDFKVGLSLDNQTFVLNHKVYDTHLNHLINLLMIDTFEELFNSHLISNGNQNIRKIFLNKLKIYLKYNGIKLDNDDNYSMLDINSLDLKHLKNNEIISKTVNPEFITFLNMYNKKDFTNDNFSFRIKQIKLT